MSMNVRVTYVVTYESYWGGKWHEVESYAFPYDSDEFRKFYAMVKENERGNGRVPVRNVRALRVTRSESEIEIFP